MLRLRSLHEIAPVAIRKGNFAKDQDPASEFRETAGSTGDCGRDDN
jgi:hypothetical protein